MVVFQHLDTKTTSVSCEADEDHQNHQISTPEGMARGCEFETDKRNWLSPSWEANQAKCLYRSTLNPNCLPHIMCDFVER